MTDDRQLTRADALKMTPEAIAEARKAGRFDDAMSGRHRDANDTEPNRAPPRPVDLKQGIRGDPAAGGQITRDQLADMSPAEIVAARDEGRLDHLLGRQQGG